MDPIVPPVTVIGPVTGSIIVLCLVIGFAMYCYRQNLDSGVYGARVIRSIEIN